MNMFNENAVSPVVGVMLMLSVTVLIAALVSTYAGGFSGSVEKTPKSTIRAVPDLSRDRISFEHNGGDPFLLSSIKIVLQEHDNKTAFSFNDAGSSLVRNFSEVGSGSNVIDSTIQAGDMFFADGEGIGSHTGMRFGDVILKNDTQVTWLVVDKASGKTISMGSFIL